MINSFFLSASKLALAGIVSSSILFLATPFITRIYPPSVYGEFALFQSIAGIFVLFASMRFSNAIPVEASIEGKDKLFGLASVINLFLNNLFIFTSLILFLILGLSPFILIGIVLTFTIWNATFINLSIANKQFDLIAFQKISQSIILVLGQIFFSYFGVWGLFIGHLLSHFFVSILYFYNFRKYFRKDIFSLNEAKNTAVKYRDFPFHSLPAAIVNNIGRQSPIILLYFLFSPEESALYSLTFMVLATPLGLISENITKVILSRLNDLKASNSLNQGMSQIFEFLVLISMPIFMILTFYSFEVFGLFFGEKWMQSGLYAQILAPMLGLFFCISPFSALLQLERKLHIENIFQLALFSVRLMSIFVGFYFNSIVLVLVLLSSTSIICFFIYFYVILTKTNINLSESIRKLIKYFFVALALSLSSTLIVDQIVSYHTKFAIMIFSGLMIYAIFSNAILTKFKKIQKTFN